jgi:hypothetical protein
LKNNAFLACDTSRPEASNRKSAVVDNSWEQSGCRCSQPPVRKTANDTLSTT